MIARQETSALSGCICIVDLDFFKRINDNFGHQVGDQVLIDFARRVQPVIRRRDSFGRIGGEEFMAGLLFLFSNRSDCLCARSPGIKGLSTPERPRFGTESSSSQSLKCDYFSKLDVQAFRAECNLGFAWK